MVAQTQIAAKINEPQRCYQHRAALTTSILLAKESIMAEQDSTCAPGEKPIGPWKHGDFGTRIYKVWESMKQRCFNPKCGAYHNYGGRGISVCSEWLSYVPFRDWARAHGYSDKLEIDRIDNNGNYEPGNVRWVTTAENSRNRRGTQIVVAFDESKCITEWASDSRCAVGRSALSRRLKAGMPPEEAMTKTDSRKYVLRNRKRDANGRVLSN